LLITRFQTKTGDFRSKYITFSFFCRLTARFAGADGFQRPPAAAFGIKFCFAASQFAKQGCGFCAQPVRAFNVFQNGII